MVTVSLVLNLQFIIFIHIASTTLANTSAEKKVIQIWKKKFSCYIQFHVGIRYQKQSKSGSCRSEKEIYKMRLCLV